MLTIKINKNQMKLQNKPAQGRHGHFVLRSVDDDAQVT